MFKNKNQKGITLVALIITIIILLILAVVEISAVTGDGILRHATNAREEYMEAQTNEKYALSQLEEFLTEYQTGVTVEQVTDIAPGVLEGVGTESEPYVINSIEDLVFFAYDVTNGNNYSGKTINLGLSLDFNSTKSYVEAYRTDYGKYGYNGELKTLLTSGEGFIPIGSMSGGADDSQKFEGSLNGNGNQINNLYINKVNCGEDVNKVGFITNNKGTISNFTLSNVNLYLKSENGTGLGGICCQNSSTGYIENCVVSGRIVSDSINGATGGITSYCSGDIKNSMNMCNITTSNILDVGGVCSSSSSTTNIENCFNLGNINTISNSEFVNKAYIGGIIGCLQKEGAILSNCYNLGEISGSSDEGLSIDVGGISGYTTNKAKMHHCYNIGQVLCVSDNEESYRGSLVGRVNNGIVENSYYLANAETPGIGTGLEETEGMAKTAEEMRSIEFVELLNQDNEGMWKQDTNNINKGYPIFSWQ